MNSLLNYDSDIVYFSTGSPNKLKPENVLARLFEEINHKAYSKSSFDKWYNKLERDRRIFLANIHSGKDIYRESILLPFFRTYLNKIPQGSVVIDIGCGDGYASIPFLKRNINYFGIDSSLINVTAPRLKRRGF